ncbi:MAG: TolC family protein [Verrucomicrobiota bacterium JB023]|nr:TolC family protein [Verrucomicrobiota bacterium JB023]
MVSKVEGRKISTALGQGLAVVLLAGCSVERPAVRETEVELPVNFSATGTEVVGDQWWREFRDGSLNSLVSRSLAGNFSLQSAAARLRQADAVLRRAQSDLGPDVDGSIEGTAFELSDDSSIGGLTVGLGASYEVDLWGRIQSSIAAENYRRQATLEDYQTAALSLSAEVALTWFQLLEAREQVKLIEGQIETNKQVVQSLEARFVQGQGRGVDILRQRQLLEATRERLTVAELQEEVLANQLSVYLGSAPGTAKLPMTSGLPALPRKPSTGLPVALLKRRPDVRSAFEQIKAADSDVATALTERYPRLTLGLETGGTGSNSSSLFSNWLTRVGADLAGPILDGGERQAEVARTRAVLEEAIADYRQTVVEAIEEVENALVRERKQLERISKLETQVSLAKRSSQQLQREFINGVSEYLDVLTALDDEQELRRTLLVARRELLEYRVALYRALAGGFNSTK